MTWGTLRGRVRTDILVREVIINSKRTRTRDARPRLSGYVWILHGIFRARIQSPCFVLKVSKSRPLKYESLPGDTESEVRIERRISLSRLFFVVPQDDPARRSTLDSAASALRSYFVEYYLQFLSPSKSRAYRVRDCVRCWKNFSDESNMLLVRHKLIFNKKWRNWGDLKQEIPPQ